MEAELGEGRGEKDLEGSGQRGDYSVRSEKKVIRSRTRGLKPWRLSPGKDQRGETAAPMVKVSKMGKEWERET